MNKKTKSLLSWGVTIFAAACGVAAFFTIFADAVNYNGFVFGTSFSGLQVALGYSVNDFVIFNASAGIIFAYLLPLIGACALIIGKGNRIVCAIAAAALIGGGVLALCTLQLINANISILPSSLAAGSISCGILAIVGGVAACGSVFLKD